MAETVTKLPVKQEKTSERAPAVGNRRKYQRALLSGSRGVWNGFASFLRPHSSLGY